MERVDSLMLIDAGRWAILLDKFMGFVGRKIKLKHEKI
jgi:hypothetical protein